MAHAGGEDQGAGDLDEREQPVADVVGVVRRGEPGESHPGPPHGEEHDAETDDADPDVTLGELVMERRRRPSDGHDEGQVEEELERCRGAMCLVGVANDRPPGEVANAERHDANGRTSPCTGQAGKVVATETPTTTLRGMDPVQGKLREPRDVELARYAHLNVLLLANRSTEQMDEICRQHGLSHSQYTALWVLCLAEGGEDGLPMGALADGLLNRAADTTRLVDRLAAAGLAERLANPSDRRGVLVRATKKGQRVFAAVTPQLQEFHRRELGTPVAGGASNAQRTPRQGVVGRISGVVETVNRCNDYRCDT